jgi:hypothetical protein
MLNRNRIIAELNAAFTGRQLEVLTELFAEANGDLSTVSTVMTSTLAKLDADGGVTDTNYASLAATAGVPLTNKTLATP